MTVVDGIIATGLQYAVKVYGSPPGESRTLVQTARNYNNQFLLALAAATSLTGFIDLSKIAVCLTQVVPFELAMAIGFGLASIYAVGSTITQFAVYLELRSARTKKKQMNQGAKASNFEFEEGKSGMKESVEVVR